MKEVLEMFKKLKKKIDRKINGVVISAQCALENRRAEMYLDTGVKALIAIVLGALLLSLLYVLLKTTVFATVSTKVAGLFNYTGPTA